MSRMRNLAILDDIDNLCQSDENNNVSFLASSLEIKSETFDNG